MYKRSSYKPSFGAGKKPVDFSEYEELAGKIKFGKSKADPSFYRPTSELVREFVASGQSLLASRSAQYDFKSTDTENGKDDGRELTSLDSPYEPDMADVSVELRHQSDKIKKAVTKKEAQDAAKAEKEADNAALAAAIKGDSAPVVETPTPSE